MNRYIYYFAYGSNLHPGRLLARTPGARFIRSVQLWDWRLGFGLQSTDGSGKCHIEKANGECCFGVVYRLRADELSVLDRYEGGYDRIPIELPELPELEVLTYLPHAHLLNEHARPYTWYRAFVSEGARINGFPPAYCQALAAFPAQVDPNPHRAQRNLRDLARTSMLS